MGSTGLNRTRCAPARCTAPVSPAWGPLCPPPPRDVGHGGAHHSPLFPLYAFRPPPWSEVERGHRETACGPPQAALRTLDPPFFLLSRFPPLRQRHHPLAEASPAEERGRHGLEAALRLHPRRRLPELRPHVAPGSHLPLHEVTAPRVSPALPWAVVSPFGLALGCPPVLPGRTPHWLSVALGPAPSCHQLRWFLSPSLQTIVWLRSGAVLPRAQPRHQPGVGSQRGTAALGVTGRHGHAGKRLYLPRCCLWDTETVNPLRAVGLLRTSGISSEDGLGS